MKRLTTIMTCLTLGCAALAGCDAPRADSRDPIIGAWESADRIGGERNEMEIQNDFDGEAIVYAYVEDSLFALEFEVTVDRDGADYEIDFECDGDCASLDFTMDCELRGDELECDADDLWNDYEFEWERE